MTEPAIALAAAPLVACLESMAAMIEIAPEPETYDDMESAYGNGQDVANWEAGQKAKEALRQFRESIPAEPLDAISSRLLAALKKAAPLLRQEADEAENSGNGEDFMPWKTAADMADAAIFAATFAADPVTRDPAVWLDRAVTLLSESHSKWEDEEESVKEEKAGHIADLDAFFEDWRADKPGGRTYAVEVNPWTGEDYDRNKVEQIAMQDDTSGEIVHVKMSRPGAPISADSPSIGIERRTDGWWIALFPGNSDPDRAFHLGDTAEAFTEIDV